MLLSLTWFTVQQDTLLSLLDSQSALERAVIDPGFSKIGNGKKDAVAKRNQIKKTVLEDSFFNEVQEIANFLDPISKALDKYALRSAMPALTSDHRGCLPSMMIAFDTTLSAGSM